jgi:ubiquinone/menaquinone biosynthesis C-methylase UbiE
MQERSHEALLGQQFGARATAYLNSAVHAQGADLEALADLVRGKPEARVLDLGCGGGHVSFAVAPHAGSVVAYDLSAEMLDVVAHAARERGLANIRTEKGMVEKLPFADATFDFVFSRYSAHHWWDFDVGLREAARVLKPGGVAAFVDSICPGVPLFDTYLQSVELLRDPSHVRSYSRAEWDAAIARAGLVCTATRRHRIRLIFRVWVERMSTPTLQCGAIRALQNAMSESVTRYFNIGADGSFDLDVVLLQATK